MNLIFYMVRTEKPGAHKGSGYNEKKKTTSGGRRWFLSCTDLDAAAGGEGLAFEEQELFGEEAGEAAQDGGGVIISGVSRTASSMVTSRSNMAAAVRRTWSMKYCAHSWCRRT